MVWPIAPRRKVCSVKWHVCSPSAQAGIAVTVVAIRKFMAGKLPCQPQDKLIVSRTVGIASSSACLARYTTTRLGLEFCLIASMDDP